MLQWLRIGVLACSSLALVGCSGSLADKLGMGKRSPDEFAVVKRQPLIVPPDYDLRPPDPNAEPPRAARSNVRTRAALTGVPVDERPVGIAGDGTSGAGSEATGEDALVARTRAAAGDPAIRERLAREGGAPADADQALFERVIQQEARPGASAEAGGATIVGRESTPMEGLGQ